MGGVISQIFADPKDFPDNGGGFIILLFHLFVYGFILSKSSNMISDGSELLLLIPSLAGIVGSVVLPVLGAVPDGAIVIFSGLGPDAQEQLSVGVGALAGSTIMLLTVPWALCIMQGRVDLVHGEANYRGKPKLTPTSWRSGAYWRRAGVTPRRSIAFNGKIMFATAFCYLFIQIPAFIDGCGISDLSRCHGAGEHWWALVTLILCILCFLGYLIYNVRFADQDEKEERIEKVKTDLIASHAVSLTTAFQQELDAGNSHESVEDQVKHFNHTLRVFFNRYDENKDGTIDKYELRLLLKDVGEDMNEESFNNFVKEIDTDQSGVIEFNEFSVAMQEFIKRVGVQAAAQGGAKKRNRGHSLLAASTSSEHLKDSETGTLEQEHNEEEEEEEEEEEVPDDLASLPPNKQKMRILWRAIWMMGLGTMIVLLFSDPMVDVLSELGNRIHVPPFYVAFVLAPIASNASELIASISYARKKTQKTITISLSALEGAASMNNTFCLGLFLLLIVTKNLVWEFSAETIAILVVETCLFAMSFKKTFTMIDAVIIVLFYPLSLFIVIITEYGGLN